MFLHSINTRKFAVFLHAKSDSTAIGISKCDEYYCQGFRLYPCTFSVKHLIFRSFLNVFQCHNSLLIPLNLNNHIIHIISILTEIHIAHLVAN